MTSILPQGLAFTETPSIKRLRKGLQLLLDESEYGGACLGQVIGASGSGKSVAAYALAAEFNRPTQNGLPSVLVTRFDRSLQSIAKGLAIQLGEKVKGKQSANLIQSICGDLKRNGVRLILVLHTDLSNPDTIDLILNIHDEHIAVTLFGSESLDKEIRQRQFLLTRCSLRCELKSLTTDEIRTLVLPNLNFSHWRPDPHTDKATARFIGRQVHGNFRQLHTLVMRANTFARRQNKLRIDLNCLKAAANTALGYIHHDSVEDIDIINATPEEVSEARQAAKARRQTRRKGKPRNGTLAQ